MKRWLCLWFPDWPLQRLAVLAAPEGPPEGKARVRDKETRGRGGEETEASHLVSSSPCLPAHRVLYEVRRGVPRVVLVSAEAVALGIAAGMPLAEARAVAGTAALDAVPSDRPADRQSLLELARCGLRFSPTVGLEEGEAPECLFLDLTGIAHLFGGERRLVEQFFAALAAYVEAAGGRGVAAHGESNTQRGELPSLFVRAAIADTPGAAWAVAHYAAGGGGPVSIERWSDRNVRPTGGGGGMAGTLTCVPPGETPAALHTLPVAALRLPPEMLETLWQLGLMQIGQLAALPREEMALRLGAVLVRRLDEAFGRRAEVVHPIVPAEPLRIERPLEYPVGRQETVESLVGELLGRLVTAVAARGEGVMRLDCRLRCEGRRFPDLPGRKEVVLDVGLMRPTAAAERLFELLRLQLERTRLPGPVCEVTLEAAWTAPLAPRQQELFEEVATRDHPRRLAELIERLASRLGRRAVLRVRMVADAQPELAFRLEPLLDAAGSKVASPRTGKLPPLGARPLRLLARPIPVEAAAVVPDGPPLALLLAGQRQPVRNSWGPERIETGWWRHRPVGRDYYRVELTGGHRLWIFRRLHDGRWFVHGAFE